MKDTEVVAKTITLPAEMLEALKQEAHKKGWNVSTLIADLLTRSLGLCDQ